MMAHPKPVELHKLYLVQFSSDPRPEGVEIVGLTARRHGDRHDE